MTERTKILETIEYDSLDALPVLEAAIKKAIVVDFYGFGEKFVDDKRMEFDTKDRLALMNMMASFISNNWEAIKDEEGGA